ncbi:MAG: acyl-ACP--UDP-N-acetylglucosamine O-acyltransferase [Gemmatimonadota bacterium]
MLETATPDEIHSTAIVDPTADIGANVSVGAYAVIGPNVRIGAGTRIAPHAVLHRDTTIGEDCLIHQAASVGGDPQDLKYAGEKSELHIGARTIIREFCTLNRGTGARGKTMIGSDCLLMAYTHVAHDCVIGNHVVIANAVNMGGHVELGDWVIVGGMTAIHQFARVGPHAFIGGMSAVLKDVPPFVKASDDPLTLFGLNSTGLQRRGFSAEVRRELKRAYRLVFASDLNVAQGMARARSELTIIPEIEQFLSFIEAGGRGTTTQRRRRPVSADSDLES